MKTRNNKKSDDIVSIIAHTKSIISFLGRKLLYREQQNGSKNTLTKYLTTCTLIIL